MANTGGTVVDSETTTPISKAARLVETNIQSDSKFPTIADLLHASSSVEYEQAIPSDWQVVTQQRLIPLPDALFEQYDLLECRCFMGLFPEIKRAWITVDHRLFLWNYEEESDFYSFEDQEQIIVSVALVQPKPGVFVDTIRHVLVVATPLEVFLLGVGYEPGKVSGARGNGGGEVALYATQISVPADGVAMTSIVGTADGRVFMSGNDGALYEFVYQSEDGWLTKKAKKINLTSTLASYFVPTFLGTRRDTPALSMAVDDQRKLLYVLMQDSSIKVFWLGVQGNEFVLAHHHKTIANSAALLCPQFNEGSDVAPFEIASIHVIPPSEARTLNLVVITSGGCRLYFSTVKRMQRFYETGAVAASSPPAQPEVFEIVHVRLPPETQPTLARTMQGRVPRQMLKVHTAFYHNGTSLLAHTWNEDHDSIIGAAPACAQILARVARQPRTTLAENSSITRVEGRTWAIAEIGSADGQGLNDLVTAASMPSRTFAVLTNVGVSILEKQRPVDMLRSLIARPALQDSQLKEFVSLYGLDETCAMCYTLLCASEFSQAYLDMQVANAARQILFEYGGVPHFVETPAFGTALTADPLVGAGTGASGNSASGAGVLGERIALSGRHNGLAIYLARTLQPVWGQLATVAKAGERGNSTRLHIGISIAELVDVQDKLRRLQHFINNNQRFIPDQINQMPLQPAGSARSTVDVTSCWNAEAASLASLYDLMVHAVEAVSFLCLMSDFNLPVISESVPDAQRQKLAGIQFSQLVCTDAGKQSCRDLILALINSQIKQDMSIDSISDVLSKRCSTMFSSSDVSLYKALEALKQASESEEGTDARDLASSALTLLTDIAGALSIEQLREICNSFEQLGQLNAIITLALACAAQSDPHGDAYKFWGDGAPENDPRESVYNKRIECYRCIISVMEKHRSSVLNANSLSKLPGADVLFHFALYDWLLDNDQSSLLFQIRSPHVEQYLNLEPRTLEKCDMLWHYYVHENRFGNAAVVQRQMACTQDFGINLAGRIEYLSLSISNAKIAIDMVRGGQTHMAGEVSEEDQINELAMILRDNEDQLEVAQVQLEIQQQLRNLGGHETLAGALDRRLFTVTELYEKFAEPMKMWDAALLIFKASNHDDPQMVEGVWRTILRTVLDDQQKTGLLAVASKVAQLGPRLYPSPAAFPLTTVAKILLDLAQERPAEYTFGYISDALVQAGVPYWAVFEALNSLYTKSVPTKTTTAMTKGRFGGGIGDMRSNTNDVSVMLAREVAALASRFVEISKGTGISSLADPLNTMADESGSSENGLPVNDVDQALSQYIVNATLHENVQLKNELQRVQENIRLIL
ncbi:hypothetical protein H4R99_000432 [Coemansia sp. RSA 1722]|nr:hypothetical protein IWW45_006682 [Coemansia sp. RSA 485]KAJ2606411.1 hypothetical protein H4R99_000432 [Coemansia sp. RSA 1722]